MTSVDPTSGSGGVRPLSEDPSLVNALKQTMNQLMTKFQSSFTHQPPQEQQYTTLHLEDANHFLSANDQMSKSQFEGVMLGQHLDNSIEWMRSCGDSTEKIESTLQKIVDYAPGHTPSQILEMVGDPHETPQSVSQGAALETKPLSSSLHTEVDNLTAKVQSLYQEYPISAGSCASINACLPSGDQVSAAQVQAFNVGLVQSNVQFAVDSGANQSQLSSKIQGLLAGTKLIRPGLALDLLGKAIRESC
jgi:hypothetical protein